MKKVPGKCPVPAKQSDMKPGDFFTDREGNTCQVRPDGTLPVIVKAPPRHTNLRARNSSSKLS